MKKCSELHCGAFNTLESVYCAECGSNSFVNNEEGKGNMQDVELDLRKTKGDHNVLNHRETIKEPNEKECYDQASTDSIVLEVCDNCGSSYELINSSCPYCSENFELARNIPPEGKDKLEQLAVIELKPISNKNSVIKVFKDTERISLGRNDIAQGDLSLSSQDHIEIYKSEGKYFLKNKSSNGAVFMKIKEDVVLSEGDLILLGESNYFKINFNTE